MCPNTSFVTGSATARRTIKLQPIVEALGSAKTAALPAFHALTGADNTGNFSGKGKPTCWKEFEEANESILRSLANLGKDEKPDKETLDGIEQFVCQLYQPKATIKTVKELWWSMFKRRKAESDRFPPTKAALHQAILRAHYQLMVWNNDCVSNHVLLSPRGYGWTMENDEWIPVMTTLSPAPEAIIQLVNCKCAKERCSTNRCQSRKAELLCTDLCSCSKDDDKCENQPGTGAYE